MDTKKELVGHFANGGWEWQPTGESEQVNVHHFPTPPSARPSRLGSTTWAQQPLGRCRDRPRHRGVRVQTLRRWWQQVSRVAYPQAERLLVCADAGGSNGYRVRAWKTELARLAAETGLAITACHLPPGTSKWNRIEHRLFSVISMNLARPPATSHEVVVN